jgi:hypothetical protein
MAKTTKSKDTLQTFFIWSVAAVFLAQVVQTIYYINLNANNAESGLWFWFFGIGVVLAIWLILLLSRSKPDLSTQTLFEVSVLTTATFLLTNSIGWFVTTFTPVQSLLNDTTSPMLVASVLYQGLPLFIVLPILYIVVRRLRATKQW